MRNRRFLSVSSLAACGTAIVLLAGCAPSTQITQWEMNEPAHATTMTDHVGSGMNGAVGTEVGTGEVADGHTTYGFGYVPNLTTVHPQHLVVVKNDNRLNPGTSDFVIGTTFRFNVSGTNVLQKGQAETPGGYYKVETHEGHVTCFFEGSSGASSVVSPGIYHDYKFHSYRCERKAAFGVRLSIDGTVVGTNPKQPGTISNNQPFVVGGKYACNQTTVECDYFTGQIDRVALAHA